MDAIFKLTLTRALLPLSLISLTVSVSHATSIVGPFPQSVSYTAKDINGSGVVDCEMSIRMETFGTVDDSGGYDYMAFRFVDSQGNAFDSVGTNSSGVGIAPGFADGLFTYTPEDETIEKVARLGVYRGTVVHFPLTLELFETTGLTPPTSDEIARYQISRQDFYKGFKTDCPGFFVQAPKPTVTISTTVSGALPVSTSQSKRTFGKLKPRK